MVEPGTYPLEQVPQFLEPRTYPVTGSRVRFQGTREPINQWKGLLLKKKAFNEVGIREKQDAVLRNFAG